MPGKNTRLSDDAEIYVQREKKTEKQKWSELHGREKWNYFVDYYLRKLIVSLIVLGFVGYFLYTVLAPQPEAILTAAAANYSYYADTFTDVQNSFSEYLNIDTEKQTISIDSSYYLPNDTASVQKLSVYIFAGEIDIFIAPEDTFLSYVNNGFLSELSELLPNDIFSSLSDQFMFGEVIETDIEGNVTSTSETGVYGVYLDSLPCFQTYAVEGGVRPVIGIVASSNYVENAIEFIDYLFTTYQK